MAPESGAATLNTQPFAEACGADAVQTRNLQRYAVDGTTPRLALCPASMEALAETLRIATTQGLGTIVRGGGTQVEIGKPSARYDLAVDMRALDALVAYEPDDFTVTVQAGMPFADLQRALAERRQFVPLDPPHAQDATVGGVIAVGRGGVRQSAFGVVRDWLLGCAIIRADGTRVQGGGRVVKNVSGYDMPKLFAGSFGTLGAIVEATFKLRPLPEADQTLVVSWNDFAAALAATRRVARAAPALQAAVAVDEAVGKRLGLDGPAMAVRAGGATGAVAATLLVAGAVASTAARPHDTEAEFWRMLANAEAPRGADTVLLRIGVPPARLTEVAQAVHDALPGAARWAYADAGLLFAQLPETESGTALATMAGTIGGVRTQMVTAGGWAVVERAPLSLKESVDVWGNAGDGIGVMRRIKAAFDPARTLSPGRFLGGI